MSRLFVIISVLLMAALVGSSAWTLNNRLKALLRPRELPAADSDVDPVWRSFRWAPSEINVEDLLEQLRLEASKNRLDAIRQTRSGDQGPPTRVWPPPWLSDLQERSRHRLTTASRKQPCAVQPQQMTSSDAEAQTLPVRDMVLGDGY